MSKWLVEANCTARALPELRPEDLVPGTLVGELFWIAGAKEKTKRVACVFVIVESYETHWDPTYPNKDLVTFDFHGRMEVRSFLALERALEHFVLLARGDK